MDLDNLKKWIGRTETLSDEVTRAPVAALSATLDRDDPRPDFGEQLPPLWHWLFTIPIHRQSDLGHDGHAQLGDFLPPVPLPRRMWAASRLRFEAPLRIGGRVTRVSKIHDVQFKQGRSGPLVFVAVHHEISNDDEIAIREEHDIVYRDEPRKGESATAAPAALTEAIWRREICPDDVLLFRYSALTFNGHRIHYDRRYSVEECGYPGLVVHGPLIATLLLDLLRREMPEAKVRSFGFRAVSPLFDTAPFAVCGRAAEGQTIHLWAQNEQGGLAMDATATLL
jgi:3-methylfumaryl-CoA hydratase